MKEAIAALLTWICLQLSVAPPPPPLVEKVSPRGLVEMNFGENPPENASVTALYSRATKTVYLREGWRADDLRDRATLLHELVHHVQETRRLSYPCVAARERDAYYLQLQWLREHGVSDPYAFLEINEFTILVYSMCSDD